MKTLMKTLYREDLETDLQGGCSVPGCTHDHHNKLTEVYLHGKCHPHAGVDACYKQGTGKLFLTCRVCGRHIIMVVVAPKPTPPERELDMRDLDEP
jgi:hypothetical protein